jgi:hypothetical protein
MPQTTNQIIAPEQESPDEKLYRELSVKLTMLDLRIAEVQKQYDDRRWLHPKITFPAPGGMVIAADAERDRLQGELSRLQMERQTILPKWAELKFSLGLSR